MKYRHAGIAFGRYVSRTDTFKAMVAEGNVFVIDSMSNLTSSTNVEILDALLKVTGALPTLADIEKFVQALDRHFMCAVSKSKNPTLHKMWVKTNSKIGKTLLASRERSTRKSTKRREVKHKDDTKELLTKPPKKKKKADSVDLVNTPVRRKKAACPKPAGVSGESPLAPCECLPSDGVSVASTPAPSDDKAHEGASVVPTPATEEDIQVISHTMMCKGHDVLAMIPASVCFSCRKSIAGDDLLTVTGEGARHHTCLDTEAALAKATKHEPLPPNKPSEMKATLKSKLPKPLNTDITEEMATTRHEELMSLATSLNTSGTTEKGMSWRIRCEPTRTKTWLKTRHQVIVRRKGSSSTPVPFEFSGHSMTNDEFS